MLRSATGRRLLPLALLTVLVSGGLDGGGSFAGAPPLCCLVAAAAAAMALDEAAFFSAALAEAGVLSGVRLLTCLSGKPLDGVVGVQDPPVPVVVDKEVEENFGLGWGTRALLLALAPTEESLSMGEECETVLGSGREDGRSVAADMVDDVLDRNGFLLVFFALQRIWEGGYMIVSFCSLSRTRNCGLRTDAGVFSHKHLPPPTSPFAATCA